MQHCYHERDGKMCDTFNYANHPDKTTAEFKKAMAEHAAGFWHMENLEGKEKLDVSRRILDGKFEAHVRGEYLVKEDVWGQNWMCLFNKDGWYMLRVGRAAQVKK